MPFLQGSKFPCYDADGNSYFLPDQPESISREGTPSSSHIPDFVHTFPKCSKPHTVLKCNKQHLEGHICVCKKKHLDDHECVCDREHLSDHICKQKPDVRLIQKINQVDAARCDLLCSLAVACGTQDPHTAPICKIAWLPSGEVYTFVQGKLWSCIYSNPLPKHPNWIAIGSPSNPIPILKNAVFIRL
jgi:hypothetical protein